MSKQIQFYLHNFIYSLDKILEGGLLTGNIYEICGVPASAKTHFCLSLTKNVILNLKQNVCFLDTKRDFDAKKLSLMLNEEQKVGTYLDKYK